MEHSIVQLRFRSEALPLAIARLNRPAFSRYELALLIWRLYESKSLNGAKIVGLTRAVPDLRAFKTAEASLVQSALIKNIGRENSPLYIWSGASDSSKFELACCLDQFSAISHLSAMEWHALTNRVSERIFVITPTTTKWRQLADEQMAKDLDRQLHRFINIERLPALTRVNVEKIGRRPLNRYETKDSFSIVKGGDFIRITSIGRTYLDMLKNPQLCGGLQHVFECIKDGAQQHLKLILNEFEAHGNSIDKVRMGFLLESMCSINHPTLDSWAINFASRGGSRKLDATMPYEPNFSSKWCLSINAPLELNEEYN